MLWAVLADEREIARQCWVKTVEPMRFAIWAAHVANGMSRANSAHTSKQAWLEAAAEYESWATHILDQVSR